MPVTAAPVGTLSLDVCRPRTSRVREVFGDFGGHVSIQRSPPRYVDSQFVDKAVEYLEGLE